MDNRTSLQRSYNMSRIRSKNTTPEVKIRKYLFRKGIRYRLHYNELFGKPDIVIKKYNSVIFVNGCFWHGHEKCKNAKIPESNMEFWIKKITNNTLRDKKNHQSLKDLGWKVIIIWECQLSPKNQVETLDNLLLQIISED